MLVFALLGGTAQGINPLTGEQATGTAVGTHPEYGVALVIPDGLYELDPTNQQLPLKPASDSISEGEYLTLYYMNIGLVLGYNEENITEY